LFLWGGPVPGDIEASLDPINKVVALWAAAGSMTSHCDGIVGSAMPGEITMVAQHDLPNSTRYNDLDETVVLMDPSVVTGVATGLPARLAPLPIRFSSFAPVDAAAAQCWKDTGSYLKDVVLADDALATPLVLGHASRLLAAVTLSTFPNTATPVTSPHDRTDHQPVLLRRAMQFIDANLTRDTWTGRHRRRRTTFGAPTPRGTPSPRSPRAGDS
jgi:hypothetical protein